MTVDQIISAINDLTEMYARARLTHAFADQAASPAERANLTARSQYWDAEVHHAYTDLAAALGDALPATPETFMPVRVLSNGSTEIHARASSGQPVVTRLTAAEALAIGTHLIAYAAIGIDRASDKVARVLPPLPSAPLFGTAPAQHHMPDSADGPKDTSKPSVTEQSSQSQSNPTPRYDRQSPSPDSKRRTARRKAKSNSAGGPIMDTRVNGTRHRHRFQPRHHIAQRVWHWLASRRRRPVEPSTSLA